MKYTATIVLLLSAAFSSLAQEESPAPDRRLAFKLYNLSTFRPAIKTGNYSFVHEFDENDYLQPAAALRIKNKRGNFHEVELSEFSIRKRQDRYVLYAPQGFSVTTAGTQVTTSAFAVRYEYSRPFFKKSEKGLVPSLGVAGSLFYERFKTTPYTTNVFPISETTAGMRGFVVPRLNWYVGQRLFFDLNVPICVLQAGYQHSNQQNPTVPENIQQMGLIKFDLLPDYYSFRLGAGWRF